MAIAIQDQDELWTFFRFVTDQVTAAENIESETTAAQLELMIAGLEDYIPYRGQDFTGCRQDVIDLAVQIENNIASGVRDLISALEMLDDDRTQTFGDRARALGQAVGV